MMDFDCSNQSNIIYSVNGEMDSMQKIDSVAYSNEHSVTTNSADISECFSYFEKHSDLTSENLLECSNGKLSDDLIFSIRLENNLDNIVRLSNNPSSFGLECNSEFDKCGCYDLVFSQNVEAHKMYKKIKISSKTDKLIRKMSKMGETYDDVIQRGFTHLDSDSEFYNQE